MSVFRRKFLAGLLFGLISLGQAYPASVAWASKKSAACCCAHQKTSCGCAHKTLGLTKKFSCHENKKISYTPAPCGPQKADGVTVNFHPEPFLPTLAAIAPARFVVEDIKDSTIIPKNPKPYPEAPPPRG